MEPWRPNVCANKIQLNFPYQEETENPPPSQEKASEPFQHITFFTVALNITKLCGNDIPPVRLGACPTTRVSTVFRILANLHDPFCSHGKVYSLQPSIASSWHSWRIFPSVTSPFFPSSASK